LSAYSPYEVPPNGTVIADRYRVLGPLGDGATGVVLRAVDRDGREVALKLMAPELAKDEAATRRFGREASALSALAHPHVIRVLDCGLAGGLAEGQRAYLVTELLEGETLDVLLRRAALAPDQALELADALLSGLSYVHQHGVIHRDLKPENLFLTRSAEGRRTLKLLDFGLAKFGTKSAWGPASVLTQEGAVLGTPGYMAPEQAFGGAPVDARADVYAAGAILFELFAGRPVFVESDPASLLRAHMLEPVPKLSEARHGLGVQPELDEVIGMALEKAPEDRFVDARVLDVALSHVPRPVAWLS
jgi:eukaryotic-like serine/threonine-protein kinase